MMVPRLCSMPLRGTRYTVTDDGGIRLLFMLMGSSICGPDVPVLAQPLRSRPKRIMRNFIDLLHRQLAGHIVVHEVDPRAPRAYRRQGKGVFVASVTTLPEAECTMQTLYPLVVRTLSNALITIEQETGRAHLVTPEMGHVVLDSGDVAQRLTTLASADFVIDNIFEHDLE